MPDAPRKDNEKVMSDVKKSPAIEKMLNEVAMASYGRTRSEYQCVQCGTDKVKHEDFKDDLSRREFSISRFCQKCQDDIIFSGD